MNRALQPEVHPDAESLSAFMEQALPQPERAQIVEHVAACSHCRQVVFLSQRAADANAPAASKPDAWFKNWHLNWRLAWVPELAAFALILILVFTHYARRTPNPAEIARAIPPAPSVREPVTEAELRTSAPHGAVKAAKKSTPPVGEPGLAYAPPSASFGVVAGEAGGTGQGYEASAQAMPAPRAFGQGNPANATAVEKPASPLEQQQIAADQFPPAATGAPTTEARFRANAAGGQASRSMATAAAPAIQTKTAAVGRLEAAPTRSMAYSVDLPKAEAVKLPSGFAAISVAAAQQRTLAIDSQGNLFVRDNSLTIWEPVVRQWSGRALRVSLKQVKAGRVTIGATVQSGPPAFEFEIVNDSNQAWVSQDGRTWKAQ
jgi:hypothetical protein